MGEVSQQWALLNTNPIRTSGRVRSDSVTNFKSDIYFYDVPGNSNGKMTHQVYIDFILELVVKF